MVTIKKILAGGLLALGFTMISTTITGCLTDDKKDPVDTTHHTAWTTATNHDVGAQGHATLGSAVDLDVKKVLLSAEANADRTAVDFLFVLSGGALKLMTPWAANQAGDVPLAAGYSATHDASRLVKVTTSPADWEAGKTAYTAGTKASSSAVANGDMFVALTGAGNYVLVKIAAVAGSTNTAVATLSISLKGL